MAINKLTIQAHRLMIKLIDLYAIEVSKQNTKQIHKLENMIERNKKRIIRRESHD